MPKIVIVGEAWGQHEETIQHPFVGAAGHELLRMLDTAGIISLTSQDKHNIDSWYKSNVKTEHRNPYFLMLVWKAHDIAVTNVFNVRPQPNNDIKNLCGPKANGISGMPALQQGKYVDGKYGPELDRLRGEIAQWAPNLVIAVGATPAWALLRSSGIRSIRGAPTQSVSTGVKVFPTYHPSAVLRDWSLRPIVIADLKKARAEAEFPELRRPDRQIWIEPTIPDLWEFYHQFIEPAELVAEDIENIGPIITMVGLSPRPDRGLVVPFYDFGENPSRNYWRTFQEEKEAWQFLAHVHSTKKLVFQNGAYDINHLWRTMKMPARGAAEDTMLLHHALHPELEKGLGFLGSIYTKEAAWKVDRKNETLKKED